MFNETIVSRRELLSRCALVPLLHASGNLTSGKPVIEPETPNPSQRLRFRRIELKTAQIEEQIRFYRDVIRLPDVAESPESCSFQAGRTVLSFHQASSGTRPFYHFAFNIPENKLEKAISWMAGKRPLMPMADGGVVADFRNWNAHAVYFFDPAGNIVELIARHNLKNAARGPFTEKDILCVSEIGVVAPNVPEVQEELKEKLGLDVFLGGSDQFTPVGGEHALFIVVKRNRPWFPTKDNMAAAFDVKVTAGGIKPGSLSLNGTPCKIVVPPQPP